MELGVIGILVKFTGMSGDDVREGLGVQAKRTGPRTDPWGDTVSQREGQRF